jgi:hypothetical protein
MKRSSISTAGNAKKLVFLGAAPDTLYNMESAAALVSLGDRLSRYYKRRGAGEVLRGGERKGERAARDSVRRRLKVGGCMVLLVAFVAAQ